MFSVKHSVGQARQSEGFGNLPGVLNLGGQGLQHVVLVHSCGSAVDEGP